MTYGESAYEAAAATDALTEAVAEGTMPKKRATAKISPAKRMAVYARDAFKCVSCGTHKNLTVDHMKPRVHGGSNDYKNLQTMCEGCNRRKGDSWDAD